MKKSWKYLMGSALSLLGFSGCINPLVPEMYGTPSADYKFLGDVKNTDGEPIEGVRVIMRPWGQEQDEMNDTLFTDGKGHFEAEKLKFNFGSDLSRATVLVEDVDGEAHGAYASQTLKEKDLTIEQTKQGDGSWYEGAFTIKANVTMEKK